MHSDFLIYTDGGARGNPGPAGIGVVIYDYNNNLVGKWKEYIGEATNNQAEYRAVILALKKAENLKAKNLKFFLDSELVVEQLSGKYKVKNSGLLPLFREILKLTNKFSNISFSHIPREKNKLADRLVNEAIDSRTSS